MERIKNLLDGNAENYILPFFWQHGEDEPTLREYMGAIQASGIGAVCLESRPHKDFCGPKWWQDLDVILDEARTRDMKVWILDDSHFPTGFANGALKDADPELHKQFLFMQYTDFNGHLPNLSLNVRALIKDAPPTRMAPPRGTPRVFDDDKVLCVIASRLTKGNNVDDTLLDITDKINGDWLYWDYPPKGMWRIYVVFTTRNNGGHADYINMIDHDSCHMMIEHVYEKHYEHYAADFGKTIVGFFSDEPSLGNVAGMFDYSESIGRKRMPLPWNKDMAGLLETSLGTEWMRNLPALWYNAGGETLCAHTRYAYMDAMTRLVEKNFSGQLGKWCEDHGVMYIGHIIEDNNLHARLSASLGHFYRSMDGQHMSGIDIIGNQVLPEGEDHFRFRPFDDGLDGEFYHFALSKLGSSHAHIDPKKKGRAMCEVFGDYGWSCGTRLMKYLTDHMLVRGINYVVPHAFSPKDFPDTDCPPHFYAHGENPLYRHFGKLMRYMNRLCHIFNDGLHVCDVAVLYHGEAEWAGDYMLSQKPARVLAENQIDYDILPSDVFAHPGYFNAKLDGELYVNGENYGALVIPYSQFITKAVAEFIKSNSARFPIVFIDSSPDGICDMTDGQEQTALLEHVKDCPTVLLKDLPDFLEKHNCRSIRVSPEFKYIRFQRYRHTDSEYYMFSNEALIDVFDGYVDLPVAGDAVIYDAMENVLRPVRSQPLGEGTRVYLKLAPYESVVLCIGKTQDVEKPEEPVAERLSDGNTLELTGSWDVSVVSSKEYPDFKAFKTCTQLTDIGLELPEFSGFIRYETRFTTDSAGDAYLEFDDAYEGVEVWLNDHYVNMKICPPYRFDLSGLLKSGENVLRVEVANTLDRKVRTILGHGLGHSLRRRSAIIEPSGLIGGARLKYYRRLK